MENTDGSANNLLCTLAANATKVGDIVSAASTIIGVGVQVAELFHLKESEYSKIISQLDGIKVQIDNIDLKLDMIIELIKQGRKDIELNIEGEKLNEAILFIDRRMAFLSGINADIYHTIIPNYTDRQINDFLKEVVLLNDKGETNNEKIVLFENAVKEIIDLRMEQIILSHFTDICSKVTNGRLEVSYSDNYKGGMLYSSDYKINSVCNWEYEAYRERDKFRALLLNDINKAYAMAALAVKAVNRNGRVKDFYEITVECVNKTHRNRMEEDESDKISRKVLGYVFWPFLKLLKSINGKSEKVKPTEKEPNLTPFLITDYDLNGVKISGLGSVVARDIFLYPLLWKDQGKWKESELKSSLTKHYGGIQLQSSTIARMSKVASLKGRTILEDMIENKVITVEKILELTDKKDLTAPIYLLSEETNVTDSGVVIDINKKDAECELFKKYCQTNEKLLFFLK